MKALDTTLAHEKAKQLKGWHIHDDCLEKDFAFADFPAAIVFMNRLVPIAEQLNHHPDWSNSDNKVHVSLTSHDAHGLTDADFQFAKAADEAAEAL